MPIHLNCPDKYVICLVKFVSSQKLYRQVVSQTVQYFPFFFLEFHLTGVIIAKEKKEHTVQSLIFRTDPFAIPKARSDFRNKWLLLQVLHIFHLLNSNVLVSL